MKPVRPKPDSSKQESAKNLYPLRARQHQQKFFASFFKKEDLAFLS
jgi:hypothetical protein